MEDRFAVLLGLVVAVTVALGGRVECLLCMRTYEGDALTILPHLRQRKLLLRSEVHISE